MEWYLFFAIIVALLVFDLGVFNKKDRVMNTRDSILYSLFYFTVGLLFGVYIWMTFGITIAAEYLTGFLIEKTLSLDNIFLISMIFTYFNIPAKYQHRVLFWGIIGVIVMRGILIYLGAAIVANYGWVMYIFGAFLIFTGIKMLILGGHSTINLEDIKIIKFLQKYFPITSELHGNKFFVRINKNGKYKLYTTPLFIALLLVEFSDLIFAVDSVPAIFSITNNIFVIYTSNIFAILGLRALYFAILIVIERFKYVKYSLSIVLVFIGSKIFLKDIFNLEKFPPLISLGVTVGIIMMGVIVSLIKTKKSETA